MKKKTEICILIIWVFELTIMIINTNENTLAKNSIVIMKALCIEIISIIILQQLGYFFIYCLNVVHNFYFINYQSHNDIDFLIFTQ